ncbi:MAG: hypothetical protein K8W52_02990 [Deltaproteobacteria bacterium]|nr:hypothetical protein [Deltaproteobacteria bacterium]
MRPAHLLALLSLAACSKMAAPPAGSGSAAPPAGSGSGTAAAPAPDAPPPNLPPGLGADGAAVALPPAATGPTVIAPRKFRHSSVRGDFRIYTIPAGLLVSWHSKLSARTVDGAPLWQHDNLGRAVAISPDGARVVANNDDGDLLILDTKTGATIGAGQKLGGRGDDAHPDVYISAFAWTLDGKEIVAVDTKHVYLLHADGTADRELPVCPGGDCFFTTAIALSNDELLLNEANNSEKGLVRVALKDGAIGATAPFQGADLDLSADRAAILADGSAQLARFDAATLGKRWEVAVPGAPGVAFAASATGASEQWKSMPKQSPDGTFVAVNDHAGRLWLLDAADGTPKLVYPEDVANFVEDVAWLDNRTLVTIDNDGRVRRIAGTPAKVVWSQDDAPEPAQWDEP